MVDLLGCPHDHPRRQCARESARPGSSALLLMGQQQTFHPNMSSKKNIPIISHMIDLCADVIYNIYMYIYTQLKIYTYIYIIIYISYK
jgi:hypothetical protein